MLLPKLGAEGASRPTLHPIVVPPFSRITVHMSDGNVFHGYLQRYGGSLPPVWISLPRMLSARDVRNPIVAYVRMPDGSGMTAVLREQDTLDHSSPAPLHAVSSIVQLRNGTSSRAMLNLLRIRNRDSYQFSTSGTSVFVGFPEGLVFTGIFNEVY